MLMTIAKFKNTLTFIECEHGASVGNVVTLIEYTGQLLCLICIYMWRGLDYDGAAIMAGTAKGEGTMIHSKFPKTLHLHCRTIKLNIYIGYPCQLNNIMDTLFCLANFSNFSSTVLAKNPMKQTSRFILMKQLNQNLQLHRTHWVKKANVLEVILVPSPTLLQCY